MVLYILYNEGNQIKKKWKQYNVKYFVAAVYDLTNWADGWKQYNVKC